MSRVEAADLAAFLAGHPPFDALGPGALAAVARGAQVERFAAGEVVLDAFRTPAAEVFVVVAGCVHLWNDADPATAAADEVLGPGGVFGFSAMLTERSVGPRAVAARDTTVARIPAALAGPAFASRTGPCPAILRARAPPAGAANPRVTAGSPGDGAPGRV